MQVIGKKERVYIRKELNSLRIGLVCQHVHHDAMSNTLLIFNNYSPKAR